MIRALIVSMGLLTAGTLVGSASAEAQSQSSDGQTPAAAGTSASDAAAKPKPKKVWTNDDMGEVTGTISVVGTPTAQRTAKTQRASPISSFQQQETTKPAEKKPADAAKKGDSSVDPKTLAKVREQLQKLQAGIDQLDRQIEQLKGASRGDSKNLGVLTSDPSSYSMEPVPDQIKALEAKKGKLQAAMDQLLDAARESGIEPGQLR
jgi:hypothetical protein